MKSHQIIHWENGRRTTVFNIVGLKEGRFTHLKLSDGRKLLINEDKINYIEIIPDKVGKPTWGELYKTYCAQTEKWGGKEK